MFFSFVLKLMIKKLLMTQDQKLSFCLHRSLDVLLKREKPHPPISECYIEITSFTIAFCSRMGHIVLELGVCSSLDSCCGLSHFWAKQTVVMLVLEFCIQSFMKAAKRSFSKVKEGERALWNLIVCQQFWWKKEKIEERVQPRVPWITWSTHNWTPWEREIFV